MIINNVRIQNYKSFLQSNEIIFTSGFNIIVGKNNVGKTALVEALSLNFDNKPHHSLPTSPTPLAKPSGISSVSVEIEIQPDELLQILRMNSRLFWVPVDEYVSVEQQARDWARFLQKPISLCCVYQQNGIHSARFKQETHDYNSDTIVPCIGFEIGSNDEILKALPDGPLTCLVS